jgi:ABC-type antimicrobial peptide transport system permease subunit
MFKNYFKIAMRNLFRNKIYSAINIIGLSLGMAMALLIGLWIADEFSVNKSFAHYDQIVRVMLNSTNGGTTQTTTGLPVPVVNELRTKYASDFNGVTVMTWANEHVLSFGDVKLLVTGGHYADPDIIQILSMKMVSGGKDALDHPGSLLIDQSTAKSLFGNKDPMNKIVKVNNTRTYKISGVFEDFPLSSAFSGAHYYMPFSEAFTEDPGWKEVETNWSRDVLEVYARLQDHVDLDKASAKVKTLLNGHGRTDQPELLLHPMSKWHLYADFKNGKNAGGAIEYIKMFALIGLFVLLLACINFMNLSTARSERRAREVGIRKVVGSLRMQLIVQFIGESLLITALAVLLSLVLLYLALPWFNQVAGKQIVFPSGEPSFWLMIIIFTTITGIIAGSYPAFYLSSFNAVRVLKGTLKAGRMASLPRKVLVVLQFTISVALIIATLVVYQELQFARNRPTGFDSKGLLTIYRTTPELYKNYDVMRNELRATGAIDDMTLAIGSTYSLDSKPDGWNWPGKDPNANPLLGWLGVASNYGKTVKWEFVQGRDFSSDYLTDSMGLVINETAVKYLGFKHPIGATMSSKYTQVPNQPLHVIGVIKDMVMESPFAKVYPTIYTMNLPQENLLCLNLKLNPSMPFAKAIAMVEPVFRKYNPSAPFTYYENDRVYDSLFTLEERIGTLSLVFAGFAIFISCLGLFGLSSFTAEQRKREIGVRKVLGASVLNVWRMLSKEFMVLIFISLCVSLPVSYYVMYNWLQRYSYRVSMSVWIFIGTIAIALFITLVTVSFQSIRASLANPVKSLRTE